MPSRRQGNAADPVDRACPTSNRCLSSAHGSPAKGYGVDSVEYLDDVYPVNELLLFMPVPLPLSCLSPEICDFKFLRSRFTPMLAENVVDLLHREFVQAHDLGLGAERGR